MTKERFYGYNQRLKLVLRGIKNSKKISKNNKSAIIEFHNNCFAEGLSIARVLKYLAHLKNLCILLKKNFKDANKKDILNLVQKIETSKYADMTKKDYKVTIKKFYKWLRNGEDYPKEVKWIKASIRNGNHKLPEELLTEEDIRKLIDSAEHIRDKALISVLYESGCRIGELVFLRVKHIQFDDFGAQIIVDGKTGMRRIRLISSSPYLSNWIQNHPLKDEPESYIWITIGTKNKYNLMKYETINKLLRKIAKKAGIKKKVNPHSFRHSRATFLAKHLTEAQMKEYFGWVQSSKMASVYVHLCGRDVDDACFCLDNILIL